MSKIKDKIRTLKDRLVKINDEEPLSKLSLIVIIALDLFVLSVVFSGLDEHTRQITSPLEYVPYECQRVFIDTSWSEANKIAELQTLVLSDYNNYSYRYNSRFEDAKIKVMHPLCKEFYKKVKSVAENANLKNLFISRQKYLEERRQMEESFNKSKNVYDTALLENIAEKRNDKDTLASVSLTVKEHMERMENINRNLAGIEGEINRDPLIQELWAMLRPENEYRQRIVDDFKRFQFWYPLKELGWQLVFLLPMFFIFYIWNSRSIKKDNRIQILISSHLLVVASIPIILKVSEVVLDLIPKHFLRNLFKLLQRLHLIAVWHYAVILGSVAAALLLIYIIQKKVFNKQRMHQKRLMKGSCYFCGKKLPFEAGICPFCGTNQLKSCSKCQKETYIAGVFCKYCGNRL